jgi:hypothetical protein
MKLKNTNPIALRVLALMATVATSQATIITIPAGNYTQDTVSNNVANNGQNSILANSAGGGLLKFESGSTLTTSLLPTPAGTSALNISVTGYTLQNHGLLDGSTASATAGVAVSAATGITNYVDGRISSTKAGVLITAGGLTTIDNYGQIQASNFGIQTAVATTVTNYATGSIIGGATTGTTNHGINAAAGTLTVHNYGSITGTGVLAATASNGILAAAAGADINNYLGATISGLADGVQATSSATIVNDGTIRGTASDGIQILNGTVTNSSTGIILGGSAGKGITFTSLSFTPNTINNTGYISGGVEFLGTTTNDTLNMYGGTLIVTATGANAAKGGGGFDTLNFTSGAATITGNVIEFENITRNGTGLASITGNTSADVIDVIAGSLQLNGTLNGVSGSAATTVVNISNTAQLFSGTLNSWNAKVVQQAGSTLSAGASPLGVGNLTISMLEPDLVTAGARYLQVHVNPGPGAQTSDLVNVTGATQIHPASVIRISPTTRNAPLQDSGLTGVDGTGTTVLNMTSTTNNRIGQFSTVELYLEPGSSDTGLIAYAGNGAFTSSTMTLSVVNGADPNDTNVTVVHHYDLVKNLTTFGKQFGAYLNTRVADALNNPVLADFLGYLDYSKATTVADVMNAYEPPAMQATQAAAVVGSREIHRIVEQQNLGDRLFPTNSHVWGNFNYNDNSVSGDSFRYTAGIGTAIDAVRIGVLISQANADISSDSKVDSLSYGLYLGSGEASGWQWNAYVGGSNIEGKTDRNPYTNNSIDFKPDGDGFQALISGAYMMDQGFCTWGPTYGVEYSKAEIDGSMDPGSNLPSMNYSADKLESLRSLLGVRAEFNFDFPVRPYLSAQWAHEFEGDSNGYSATLEGSSFNVGSPYALSEDSFILRAGLIIGFGGSWYGDIGYLGELSTDSDGADFSGLNVGLRASF